MSAENDIQIYVKLALINSPQLNTLFVLKQKVMTIIQAGMVSESIKLKLHDFSKFPKPNDPKSEM